MFHRGACLFAAASDPDLQPLFRRNPSKESLRVCARAGKLRVIVAHDRQLLTDCGSFRPKLSMVRWSLIRTAMFSSWWSRVVTTKSRHRWRFVRNFGLVWRDCNKRCA